MPCHVQTTTGQKAHTWLNLAEVRALLTSLTEGGTVKGLRDRIVLGLLAGAGLRRDELTSLTWEDIKRQGDRTVLSITGKGNKRRVIPINEKLVDLLEKWADVVGRAGYIARSVTKGGELGASISGQAILDIVDAYGQKLGKEKLLPHDLRRTFATVAESLDISPYTIKALVNHSLPSDDVTGGYIQIDVERLRCPMQQITDFLLSTGSVRE